MLFITHYFLILPYRFKNLEDFSRFWIFLLNMAWYLPAPHHLLSKNKEIQIFNSNSDKINFNPLGINFQSLFSDQMEIEIFNLHILLEPKWLHCLSCVKSFLGLIFLFTIMSKQVLLTTLENNSKSCKQEWTRICKRKNICHSWTTGALSLGWAQTTD